MTATIYTLACLNKEPAEVIAIAERLNAILFDVRRSHSTSGTVRTKGSARQYAKLYEAYEKAPYLLPRLRPEMIKQIILARPKPLLVLVNHEQDEAQVQEFLTSLDFIVTPYSARQKTRALPLFDQLQDFSILDQ